MTETWVDFKAVKAAVSFADVLAHYGVQDLKTERDELVGRCPIHKGQGARSFHVSLSKKAFHCFSCKARGNVLDFVAAMEPCLVRDAALKLQNWFSVAPASSVAGERSSTPGRDAVVPEREGENAAGLIPVANVPLSFQLQGIDPTHGYLRGRGVSESLARQFGFGYFSGKGSMRGRIVIPIDNSRGELVAYAGRSIDEQADERYRFPAGFKKTVELYNLSRVRQQQTSGTVVLVEGFFGCWRVAEAGHRAVALMGSSLSDAQASLLVEHFERVVLLFDGDEAGRRCTDDCLRVLGRRLWVRAIALADGQQPDHFTAAQIRALLP